MLSYTSSLGCQVAQLRDTSCLLTALRSCTTLRDIEQGKLLHAFAVKTGSIASVHVATSLITMYSKCGRLAQARLVFDSVPDHNVVSWTALILGYADNGEGEVALQLFSHLRREGLPPNAVTFIAAAKACTSLAEEESLKDASTVRTVCLNKAREIYSQAAYAGCHAYPVLANSLIHLFAKCGSIAEAQALFDRLPQPTVVSWTVLIMGYVDNGEAELGLHLYAEMQRQGCLLDTHAFAPAVKACTLLVTNDEMQVNMKLTSPELRYAVHSQGAKLGYGQEIVVTTALVDLYTKAGSMDEAWRVFNGTHNHDVVGWSALLLGYVDNGDPQLAVDMFARMHCEGCSANAVTFVAVAKACTALAATGDDGVLQKTLALHARAWKCGCSSNTVLSNCLIDSYAKCRTMVEARRIFDNMRQADSVTWTTVMMGYVENENGYLALELFRRMRREGWTPEVPAFVAAIRACGGAAALEAGIAIQAEVRNKRLESERWIGSALVDFYGRCGCMLGAEGAFAESRKDVIAWNALMAGYSRNGDMERVFEIFDKMRDAGLELNRVTLLCVLAACSHAGLIEKGRQYLEAMESKYEVTPSVEHYSCMIDMLCRANELEAALLMAEEMPCKANAWIWKTILYACKRWKNAAVGKSAFECWLRLGGQDDAGPFASMANIMEEK